MTTTIIRDSLIGDDWIRQVMAGNPVQRIIDPVTGNYNGDILTGPVRLAFESLFELPKPRPGQNSEPKHGAHILFPLGQDFTIFYEEYYKLCGQHFPEYYDAGTQQYHGLHSPFRDQAEKLKFGGFTPGCTFFNCTSKYKPPVVDVNKNPIVDRNKVYPGVWAICAVRPYHYGKNPPQPKKGVAFGLQSVMIIADDKKFGQSGPDVNKQFAQVNVHAPVVRPNVAAGMPTAAAPPPAAGIPGYTAPGGGVPTHQHPPQQPHIPQTHYAPAQPQGYQPPAPGGAVDDDNDMSFLN